MWARVGEVISKVGKQHSLIGHFSTCLSFRTKTWTWKAIVVHPCTVLICLPILEGLHEFINHECKAIVLGFILNYIPVQSTPHGHTSQSTHLYSNSCCENQLPTVYLRSQKWIKLMWIIAIIRHTAQNPETALLLISSCEFPVQMSPRCRRKRQTISCFKAGNESYTLASFWSLGPRGFLSDHIFVFCSK